jgi:hypothetical protein
LKSLSKTAGGLESQKWDPVPERPAGRGAASKKIGACAALEAAERQCSAYTTAPLAALIGDGRC